jgi:hypothetical protein
LLSSGGDFGDDSSEADPGPACHPSAIHRNGRRIQRNLKPRPHEPRYNELDTADEDEPLAEDASPGFYKLLEQASSAEDAEDDGSDLPARESVAAGLDGRARQEFLGQLTAEDQHGPFARRWMWQICPQRQDADVLATIIYWSDPPRGHAPDQRRGLTRRWTANTVAQLAGRTGWSEDQIGKSLRRLQKAGLIGWKNCKFAGRKTRHLWVEWRAIQKAWKEHCDKQQIAAEKGGNEEA